jgi:hypothetical protein
MNEDKKNKQADRETEFQLYRRKDKQTILIGRRTDREKEGNKKLIK